MTTKQQAETTIEDLANRLLKVLQRNLSGNWRGIGRLNYQGGQLSSVRSIEFGGDNPLHPNFADRYAEAVNLLRMRGFIMTDPNQRSEDFGVLTEKGRSAKTIDG